MNTQDIIDQIEIEISRLQQAKSLLQGSESKSGKRSPGRPKNNVAKIPAVTPKKRKLSAAGRKKISDAMKKRWAKRRATPKKATKTTPE
jgi:hypothetical protein